MRNLRRAVLTLFLLLVSLALLACGQNGPREMAAEIPMPTEMRQATPEEAVETYLEWLTFAYRYADSEVATPTMTADMAQRVSYYITMNLSADRVLNQRLDSFEIVEVENQNEIALVKTKEAWTFNYLSPQTGEFGDDFEVTYSVRYTVIVINGMWRVQNVAAERLSTTEPLNNTDAQDPDEALSDGADAPAIQE